MKRMSSNHKGFTIVEIMIVVAIIGILVAIAVPGFLKARERTRQRQAQEAKGQAQGKIVGIDMSITVESDEGYRTKYDVTPSTATLHPMAGITSSTLLDFQLEKQKIVGIEQAMPAKRVQGKIIGIDMSITMETEGGQRAKYDVTPSSATLHPSIAGITSDTMFDFQLEKRNIVGLEKVKAEQPR